MKSLLIATTNSGKVKECQSILKNTGFHLMDLTETISDSDHLPSEKENGDTFKANAIIKANYYAKITNLLTLADDSGLAVDYLDGKPGVHSQRFGPSTTARNLKVLDQLKGVPLNQRSAKFVSVVAILDPNTNRAKTYTGEVKGFITTKPQGNNGFGYDPIFYSIELNKTFSQATKEEKNSISHRGRALQQAIPYLNQLN